MSRAAESVGLLKQLPPRASNALHGFTDIVHALRREARESSAADLVRSLALKSGMDAAILFENDGYRMDGPKLMGRQSAGNGFLRAAVAADRPRRDRSANQASTASASAFISPPASDSAVSASARSRP